MLLNQKANELVSNEIKYHPVSAGGSKKVLPISELALTQSEVKQVEKSLIDKG